MSFRSAVVIAALVVLPVSAAHADEGMWTFDAFPAARMTADYGWAPDQAWLDKVRAAALNRTVAVSTAAIEEALKHIYPAPALLAELKRP